MRRLLAAVAIVGGVVAGGGFAVAADLPPVVVAPPPPPAAPPPAAPAFSWTGFYVGAHAGYAWGTVVADYDLLGWMRDVGESIDQTTTYPIAGIFGGLSAGYNLQAGPVVFGVNGEINLANITGGTSWPIYGDANDTVSSLSRWFGSIAARLGLAFGQVHVYGLAGWAIGNFTHTLDDPPYTQSVNVNQMGPTFGGGLEVATASGLVISAEYRMYKFDSQALRVPSVPAQTIWWEDRIDFTPTIHSVRVGISKLF